ncbi:MAG TPA: hypothetical protein VME18_00155 [Acidobacteriaceae bacterium]|nr:hypothetical protein [Acidobacteriaceae bacterium]
MTTEQNQPQPPADYQLQAQAPNPEQAQNQGHGGHRRRRRRKRNKGGAAHAQQPQGQQPQNLQAAPQPHQHKQKPPKQQPPSSQSRFFRNNGNGQMQGGQGGGRRRNKQRRERVFVGPMDHSYRTVNGNVADAPPSTIEFRNGNVNGNGNGFYMESAGWDSAVPPPIREDAPTRIFLFIEDLFFLAKINETARKLGVKVAFVKNDPETLARIVDAPEEERPSLVVFDLNNSAAKPLVLIPKLKAKLKRGTSVIGFLSHLQGDLKAKALEAGCDMVMPRSAFSQNLPTLLRRHGLDEEQQEMEYAQA